MLVWTGLAELTFALLVVYIGPVATQLDQAGPPVLGWVVAVASVPVVLGVDALDKWIRARRGNSD